MPRAVLVLVVFILIGTFAFFIFLNIAIKLQRIVQTKRTNDKMKVIKKTVAALLSCPENEFTESLGNFTRIIWKKGRSYMFLVDQYLQSILENPEQENRQRLITIANLLGFASECTNQIKSRNSRISAMGARRAGLYHCEEVAEHMVAALDFLSSENQFEILMGLARLGKAEPMIQAFEKIKNSIIINERAVIEILLSFPSGTEKAALFKFMLGHQTTYLAALCLKAIDRETATDLMDEIIKILRNGDKENRAAAVKALAALNKDAPVKELIMALEDPVWEIRALAAKALGHTDVYEASLALFHALKDKQWWVRQNSAMALSNHSGYEKFFLLAAAKSGDKYAVNSIISTLQTIGNTVLIDYIKDFAAKEPAAL